MKYRQHRGTLGESEKTAVEVGSLHELREAIKKDFSVFGVELPYEFDDIRFQYVGFDERIGQETYYVMVRNTEHDKWSVMGMSDGQI